MNADRARQKQEDDLLERKDFVKQIADVLVLDKDAPSIVVGIEGSSRGKRVQEAATKVLSFGKLLTPSHTFRLHPRYSL